MPTFETGIVMAGAISAGAYTAGVMDFIIEALDAYEKKKNEKDWNGPRHNVRVPILAGASAGGMTAAISALQAFHNIEHVKPSPASAPKPDANRLYSSWVTDVSIERLLETSDLSHGRERGGVKSLLCCDILDQIAEDVFKMKGAPRTRPWMGRGDDTNLRVFLTLSNLRGVPYSFPIFGSNKPFGMLNHGDYIDFTVGINPSPVAGSCALDISNLTDEIRDRFKTTVLATGAFPIGLLPRRISRNTSDYWTSQSVGYEPPGSNTFKTIDPRLRKDEIYEFVAVDGGMINNEPLEIARRYLAGPCLHNDQNGESASKAVILIAPFPDDATAPPYDPSQKLLQLLPKLVSTLIDQARFKPDELAKAADDTVFSRFMISPSRQDQRPIALKYPIACGPLGGFSGFLHESFRRHDYLLGRRNAQAFLRWTFALPESNKLFDDLPAAHREKWYVRDISEAKTSVTVAEEKELAHKRFAPKVGVKKTERGLPIIPLVDNLAKPIDIGAKDLPAPNSIDFYGLKKLVRKRAEKVAKTLVDLDLYNETSSMMLGGPVRYVASIYGTEIISQNAMQKIKDAARDVKDAFGL